jgi:hypothetical protein
MYKAVMNVIRDEVRAGTRKIQPIAEFTINHLDASDLERLTYADLIALNYAQDIAQEVSSALFHANLVPLGRTMGVKFKFDDDIPSWLDN